MLRIKENNNNVEEFNYLYNAVGWGAYNKNISKKALDNTYYSVSIYDDNNIIGYRKFGFITREENNLGAEMIYNK